MLKKIISGGQTGVERAALDAAIKLDIPHDGWTYKGRKTEEGVLPEQYNVKEIENPSYFERLENNIVDSDGTVILTFGQVPIVNRAITDLANKHKKPYLHIDLIECTRNHAIASVRKWMIGYEIETVYFTGSKPHAAPNVYEEAMQAIEGIYQVQLEQKKLNGFQHQENPEKQ